MDKQKQDLLNDQNWEEIILRLTNYAVNLYNKWNLCYDRAIKDYSPDEIALEAIKKVFTEEWSWDSKIDLTYFLFKNLKGMIFNLALRKKENILGTNYDVSEYETLSNKAFSIEDEMTSKIRIEYLYNQIKGNKIEENIFLGWTQGMKKREICKHYNISDTEYKNAYKRVKNKLLKLNIEKQLKS